MEDENGQAHTDEVGRKLDQADVDEEARKLEEEKFAQDEKEALDAVEARMAELHK